MGLGETNVWLMFRSNCNTIPPHICRNLYINTAFNIIKFNRKDERSRDTYKAND